jgi:hypothetical protein
MDRPSTFATLRADAEAVPVPSGVSFVRDAQSIEHGPGFATGKFEQVVRQFATSLSCDSLEDRWVHALEAAHRRFQLADYPHSYGAHGSLGIRITGQTHALGITLGSDDGHCEKPFVYSFNAPH